MSQLKEDQISPEKKLLLEAQLVYQKKLNNITNQIHSANNTNEILLNLQGEILGLFDADRITVYLIDGIKKQIVSRFKTGNETKEIRIPINCRSLSGFCAATGNVMNFKDVYDKDELKELSPQLVFDQSWDKKSNYKTTQVLVAPIFYNKFMLGVIQVINKKGNTAFTKADQIAILDIAKVLGLAFYKNQKASKKNKPTKFDFLITNNIISGKDLIEAMLRARKTKRSIESILISDFQVSKDDIGKSLSNFFNTRFIPYDDKMVIPGQLLKGLKVNFLKNNLFVPITQDREKVIISMGDPSNLPVKDAIKRLISAKEYEYCVSTKDDIFNMIDLFFDVKRTEMMTDSGSIEDILGQLDSVDDDEMDANFDGLSEDDSAIVKLVNKMIVDAYNRDASDIHVEPGQGKNNAEIRFRIDGSCQIYQTIPYTYKRAMVSRLKIMSDLDIAERRLPQDGKIKFRKFAPLDIELRVATIPSVGQNEDVVMRILASGDPIPLEKMGLSERNYNSFIDMVSRPYGIILVVGPTGSGKTTTLHAGLSYINKPETKIWTAEDPVEITQKGLRQVQVQAKIGFNFATAMRAFLRADPDVIMVGEMRDHETVSTGIEASLTGHLVFSTLHTNSAPETITRLLDMGMDPFNFADALLGVLAQRLVRTLCKDCKEKYHPDRKEFEAMERAYHGDFNALGFEYNDDFFLYKPAGCAQCGNTGYRGRTGIHELLIGTDPMKNFIQNRAKMEDLRTQSIEDGMTTLLQDGIRKVCLGQTDLLQVRKVCIK